MSDTSAHSRLTPRGWHAVTPRIVARGAVGLVEFLQEVFGAVGTYRPDRPTLVHIGDSVLMISDAGVRNPAPAFLYVYVTDADAVYNKAIEQGALSLEEPLDTPYGDRRAMVEDAWGNRWQIATYRGGPGAA